MDLDPVGSALFCRIRIRIVTGKTDPGSIKGMPKRGTNKLFCFFHNLFIRLLIYNSNS